MTMGRGCLSLGLILALTVFAVLRGTAEEFATQGFHVTGVSQSDPDGLTLRAGPGAAARKVGSFRFDADGIYVGTCKTVRRAEWCHVKRGATVGWVNMRFLALSWSDGGQPPPNAIRPAERPAEARRNPRDALCGDENNICQDVVQEAIDTCFAGNRGQDFINCKEESGINQRRRDCWENWRRYCEYESNECPIYYRPRYRPACRAP